MIVSKTLFAVVAALLAAMTARLVNDELIINATHCREAATWTLPPQKPFTIGPAFKNW
jgi:hypothetical protein